MNHDSNFLNPRLILPGCFPDPSICRRGNNYFIVNSSFGFFPGLPIHHSRDLVNWEFVGCALDRPSPSGPWEPCPRNPILTHRSIGAKIQSPGHADLVQYATGDWWITSLGVRQRHFRLDAKITVDSAALPAGAEAGLAVFMSERCHYALGLQTRDGARVAVLTKRVLDLETHDTSPPLAGGPVRLEIEATSTLYTFSVYDSADRRHLVGTGLSRLLGTEVAGGFTGVFLGPCVSAPAQAPISADFTSFSYEAKD